jgi:hypothetical protein
LGLSVPDPSLFPAQHPSINKQNRKNLDFYYFFLLLLDFFFYP